MNNLHLTDINLYAVIAAWIIHTASGLIWFQPKLFGNEWSKLTGKELNPAKKWLIPGLAGHLAMVLVLVEKTVKLVLRQIWGYFNLIETKSLSSVIAQSLPSQTLPFLYF